MLMILAFYLLCFFLNSTYIVLFVFTLGIIISTYG